MLHKKPETFEEYWHDIRRRIKIRNFYSSEDTYRTHANLLKKRREWGKKRIGIPRTRPGRIKRETHRNWNTRYYEEGQHLWEE